MSRDLVAVGVLEADVDRPARCGVHLGAADLGGGLELARRRCSRLNLRLPRTLVRSPTRSGRLSSVSSTASRPETRQRRWLRDAPRGAGPRPARPGRVTWAGVVPQQPPTRLSQPASSEARRRRGAKTSGPLGVAAVLVGQAGVGHAGHAGAADLGERAHVVGHQVRAGGAVEPHVEQVGVERARRRAPRRPGRRAWCRWSRWWRRPRPGSSSPPARRPARCRSGRP